MSSRLCVVGDKHPLILEYCLGTSSPGSPQIHSLCLQDGASSNVAKLGVMPEVVYCVEIKLSCCSKWYKILYLDSYFYKKGL